MDKRKEKINSKETKKQKVKGNSNGPIVIEFNLSKAVALITAIVIIVGTITTTKIITTLMEGKEKNALATVEGQNSERVDWVTSSDGKQVPVPKGYSASQIPGETTVNGGFVIYEGDIDWSTILVGGVSTTSLDEEPNKNEELNTNENEKEIETEDTSDAEDNVTLDNSTLDNTNSQNNQDETNTTIESDDKITDTKTELTTEVEKEEINSEEGSNAEETEETDKAQDTEQTNKTEETQKTEQTNTGIEITNKEENVEQNNNTEEIEVPKTIETQNAIKEKALSIEDNTNGEDISNIENTNKEIETLSANISPTSEKTEDDEGIAPLAEEGTATQEQINIFNLQKSTNQWVWVPVDEEELKNIYGVDSNGKLWGKLWNFPTTDTTTGTRTPYSSSWTETDGIMSIASKTTYREPDVTHFNTNYDVDSELQRYLYGETQYELLSEELENHFYETIESIKKYGGFYIGRYETGGLNGTAVVRKMDENIASQTWYTMYKKCKTLSGENSNVVTSMIWGSLWDATLEWLVKSGATNSAGTAITYKYVRSDSTSWGNYRNSIFKYIPSDSETGEATETKASSTGTPLPTGSSEYTKVNNIYDMAGNVGDGTLEANSTDSRVYRGNHYGSNGSFYPAYYRSNYSPTGNYSSRRLSCPTFN